MDWSRGFTSKYYGAIVDPDTWRDTTKINISSGSINLNNSGLRESGDFTCDLGYTRNELYVRIYLDARQENGGASLNPLFTGMVQIPKISYEGRTINRNIQCYSVLKPAEDILLPLGWYVMAGTNGGEAVRNLLGQYIKAPIFVGYESPNLSETLLAENGETVLSMVDYILDSINWRLYIEGNGTVRIVPKSESISARFDAYNFDVIESNLDIEYNWYDCPNVFRAIQNDSMAIVRDEDPNSVFSIPSRGREIWKEDVSASLAEGESLAEYAQRQLKKEQNKACELSYKRRFVPTIRPSDLVRIRYPEQNIDGIYEVESQTINLADVSSVSEKVKGGI